MRFAWQNHVEVGALQPNSLPTDYTTVIYATYIRWYVGTYYARVNKNRPIRRNPSCDCSGLNQMPLADQITEIASYVLTYL